LENRRAQGEIGAIPEGGKCEDETNKKVLTSRKRREKVGKKRNIKLGVWGKGTRRSKKGGEVAERKGGGGLRKKKKSNKILREKNLRGSI